VRAWERCLTSLSVMPTYGGRVSQLGNLFPQAVPEAVGDSREDPHMAESGAFC
jgi:hypothetical protein